MSTVIADRFTTRTDDPFVVFLIGMQVNKFFAFRKWLGVAQAMPRMMAVLQAHPEKGFLHGEVFFRFAPLNVLMVSYWRSFWRAPQSKRFRYAVIRHNRHRAGCTSTQRAKLSQSGKQKLSIRKKLRHFRQSRW